MSILPHRSSTQAQPFNKVHFCRLKRSSHSDGVVSMDHSFVLCVFTSCHAYPTLGGAIRGRSGGDLTISRCIFSDNSCLSDKAGRDDILAVGRAIRFFEQNKANLSGCVDSERATSSHFKQSNMTKGSTILSTEDETIGDSAILISNKLQQKMAVAAQTDSILSPTGSLSMSELTLSTSIPGTTRTSSFFVMTGVSASLASVIFRSLSSPEMAHSKVNETAEIVYFVMDVKMAGTIVSTSSGSIIKSSSGKKITAESTCQFCLRLCSLCQEGC
ncbi:hypothetical protein BLNAU_2433 [Blattamonas nauphoetae]|uniref:Uncharacterized protein n=1 Tax=Blattamonas nauphoetae TaxID=2049346 RepID=A0ABQ9YG18_9EUKA|nr:hypothetical protein BLNAU_2433 [Blattamonas nauphoetae]